MSSFKEIVTKAVIGKCKKKTTASFDIQCDQKPNTVLGCWVINHAFNGVNNLGNVNINGSYDVNVWYSYDNDTKTAVYSQKFNYSDMMNMTMKKDSTIGSSSDIMVECLKQPTVVDVKIIGDKVSIKVDKEMGVQVIGNTTVKVAIEDDEDEYEELFDNENDKELDINNDELDDNFIEESTNNS